MFKYQFIGIIRDFSHEIPVYFPTMNYKWGSCIDLQTANLNCDFIYEINIYGVSKKNNDKNNKINFAVILQEKNMILTKVLL